VFLTGYSPFRSVGLTAKRDTGPCATTGNEPRLGDLDNRNRSRTWTNSTRCRCSFESRISIAAKPWSWSSVEPYGPGPFRTSDIEQMRMGVLEHLKIAQGPAWLFAAELREGTILRLLTPSERRVPIVAVRPPQPAFVHQGAPLHRADEENLCVVLPIQSEAQHATAADCSLAAIKRAPSPYGMPLKSFSREVTTCLMASIAKGKIL
jgi:hypothetical protein